MIIVKLNGGLGNQMFQYAFGKALSLSLETTLKFDISWFQSVKDGETIRKYELDFMLEEISFASEKEIQEIKGIYSLLPRRAFYFLNSIVPSNKQRYYIEKYYHYDNNVEFCSDNTYFEGYWQTNKYFEKYKEVIIKNFIQSYKFLNNDEQISATIDSKNTVSLHIRRGDYVSNMNANSYHGICSLEYYYKTIKYISTKEVNLYFIIFSDDIKWAKDNLKISFPVLFIENTKDDDPFEDMYLMSLCKHNIIANSSFSWWGAYLNLNKEKIVMAPKQWFKDETINTSDLIPSNWVRL